MYNKACFSLGWNNITASVVIAKERPQVLRQSILLLGLN